MPIYEYQCLACSKEFETLVWGDDDDIRCPHCDSAELKRLLSVTRADNLEQTLSKAPGDNLRRKSGADSGEIF